MCKSADNKRAGTPARCGEITLGADIKQSITIPEGRTLTLDLNGHTLTNSEGGHTVTNYGTLTIKDGSAGSNGAVDNISGGRGALVNYGTATVNSGSIVRGEDAQGSWYVIKNYGYMTLGKDADSPVKVDTNSDGSSLIANGYYDAADKEANAESITVTENACTLVVNGGTYTNGMNTVKNDNDGVLTINNGSFTNKYEAGSVVMSAGKLTIADGTFIQENSNPLSCALRNAGSGDTIEIAGGNFTGELLNQSQNDKGFSICGRTRRI